MNSDLSNFHILNLRFGALKNKTDIGTTVWIFKLQSTAMELTPSDGIAGSQMEWLLSWMHNFKDHVLSSLFLPSDFMDLKCVSVLFTLQRH
jgi:hypothetical protein